MEPSRHFRHGHHRHHGHHDSKHKSRKTLEDLAHHHHSRTPDPNSYVESWLENAPSPHAIFGKIQTSKTQKPSKDRIPARLDGRHHSRDSSIIAAAAPAPDHEHGSHRRDARMPPAVPVAPQPKYRTTHRKRPRTSPSSHSEQKSLAEEEEEQHRYEKRARHKTRADKYEPNHGGPARRKPVEDSPKVKERKPNEKRKMKKSALATTGDLMERFSSHAIHSDRLTIKPFMQAGMFGNSKVGKAPGDLSFGSQMGFLKDAKPQELPNPTPKTRGRDHAKSQKEVEDIEVFFSHYKPKTQKHPRKPSKNSHPTEEAGTSPKPPPRDDDLPTKTRSSRAGVTSKATTYISWSPSITGPAPRPGAQPEVPSQDAESPVSSPRPKEYSSTPDDIRQALIKTGIYRSLPERKHRSFRSLKDVPEQVHGHHYKASGHLDAVSPEVPISRKDIVEQAYVKRRDALRQASEQQPQSRQPDGRDTRALAPVDALSAEALESQEQAAHQEHMRRGDTQQLSEGPPRPRPPGRTSLKYYEAIQERRNVPAFPPYDSTPRYLPFDRSQDLWTMPADPAMLSPRYSGPSSQYRSPAAMAPPPKPISRFTYAEPLRQSSTVNQQSRSSLDGAATILDGRGWLLNSSHGTPGTGSHHHHPSPRLSHHEQAMPDRYESEAAASPLLEVRQENLDGGVYMEDVEQYALGAEEEGYPPTVHPPVVPAPNRKPVQGGPFSTPFFRNGTTGYVPPYPAVLSAGNFWTPQSDLHSTLANTPLVTKPRYNSSRSGTLTDRRDVPMEGAPQGTRWPIGMSGGADDGQKRYWPPNTYGLR